MSDAEFETAVARAGAFLRASRAPLIAGLGADVAGSVAAFRLARNLGAPIDHAGAEWALRDQAVLQDIGLMLVSPGEARQRADMLLLLGDRPLQAWPDLADFLFADGPSGARKINALGSRAPGPQNAGASWLRANANELPSLLAALRARVNGRPLAHNFKRTAELDNLATTLKAASFGVALWCPDEIDALTIEMLTGLIKDLNAATRWSGLSVSPDASVTAAAMASGWMSGLPLRSSFARDRPRHDSWQYDARRLVESREADAVVWISVFGDAPPDWLGAVPAIVLGEPSATSGAAISIPVGRPGRDHDGVVYDRMTGTLVEVLARAPNDMPSAAEALTRIAAAVSEP